MTDRETTVHDFRLRDWIVSPDLNQISRNGEKVVLQNLSMQVLVYLAGRRGEVVTYAELLDNLWPNRYVGEDAIHRRISDLRNHLGDDRKDPKFIKTISKKGYRLVAPVEAVSPPRTGPWRWVATAAGVALGLALLHTALETDDPPTGVPDDLVPMTVFIESNPPGATVSFRPYADDSTEWQPIGITPLQAELPGGTYRLRFIADGRAPVTMAAPNPSMVFNNVDRDYYVVELPEAASVPDGMVYIPGGNHRISLLGINRPAGISEYYIGRTEVSNREFAEFVTAGGYESPEFWVGLDEGDDEFDYSRVPERFVDTTGNPGPAGWAGGTYPEGAADLPVTGVSWYEAMAYARFRGLKLPSAIHWARAALGLDESRWPLAPVLLATARTDAASPVPVDDERAMSTWGSINMIGNVREWTVTTDGEARLSLGLGYASQQWAYASPTKSLADQRAPDQGIRLAYYDDDFQDMRIMMAGVAPKIPRVSADDLEDYLANFAYVPGTVNRDMVTRETSAPEHDWIRERYVLDADVLSGKMPVLVFRPRKSPGPLQPVIFLPPADSYTGAYPSTDIDITSYGIEFVVRNGRALVWPVITGTHEREGPSADPGREAFVARWLAINQQRRLEIGAVLDWFSFDDQFDGNKAAILAASFGATFVSSHILASEPRLRAAVLMSGYVANIDTDMFPDVVNPNSYWPAVEQPILVLNGRYDIATHQNEMRDLLVNTIGTPAASKHTILV